MAKLSVDDFIYQSHNQEWDATENGSFIACFCKTVIPLRSGDTMGVTDLREVLKAPNNGHCDSIGELRLIASRYMNRKPLLKEDVSSNDGRFGKKI